MQDSTIPMKDLVQTKQMHRKYSMRGFTLVEVLVALLVLAIGLLGLAALQTTGVRFNQESYLRSQAILIAYDIVDRIRANATGKTAGNYDNVTASATFTAPACLGAVSCTPANIATYDLAGWKARIAASLPAGTGEIATSGNRRTITITWAEKDLSMSTVVEVDL
jgi:type IV pilus assembly protein PilV